MQPTYQQAPDVLARDTLGGVLLLPPGQDKPLMVSHPGDVLWSLLAQPTSRGSLVQQLSQAYQAPEEVVSADIAPVLKQLVSAGALLMVSGEPGEGAGQGH